MSPVARTTNSAKLDHIFTPVNILPRKLNFLISRYSGSYVLLLNEQSVTRGGSLHWQQMAILHARCQTRVVHFFQGRIRSLPDPMLSIVKTCLAQDLPCLLPPPKTLKKRPTYHSRLRELLNIKTKHLSLHLRSFHQDSLRAWLCRDVAVLGRGSLDGVDFRVIHGTYYRTRDRTSYEVLVLQSGKVPAQFALHQLFHQSQHSYITLQRKPHCVDATICSPKQVQYPATITHALLHITLEFFYRMKSSSPHLQIRFPHYAEPLNREFLSNEGFLPTSGRELYICKAEDARKSHEHDLNTIYPEAQVSWQRVLLNNPMLYCTRRAGPKDRSSDGKTCD